MENATMQRMQELVDKLNTYARAYYVEDAPLISDGEYDALEAQLIALEKETGMVLEKNFCASIVTFNVTVEELQNINKKDGTADAEPMYFEF